MAAAVDYIATAESYGFRIQTRAEFEAATDRPEGLLERANRYPGSHVIWDPNGDGEDWMLVGDGRDFLAQQWFDLDFSFYGRAFQSITYVEDSSNG